MIIFIAGVFSGHILVKKIILSELYCCNMIIFCKLLKIKIVQTSLCRGAFLAGLEIILGPTRPVGRVVKIFHSSLLQLRSSLNNLVF